jgi:hypothetical protein
LLQRFERAIAVQGAAPFGRRVDQGNFARRDDTKRATKRGSYGRN